MPIRGERAAPIFDKTKPRELTRFFDDLEYLFDRATITSAAEKKRLALRYIDFDTEQAWKSFPEYSNATTTYSDFKETVLGFYPDIYSLGDMEHLVSNAQRTAISTISQLSDFHLQFLAISSWLIKEQQIDRFEQRRSYIRAFGPQLLSAIHRRLQIKLPDHFLNVPYPVSDVYEAARFILQSVSASAIPYPSQSIPISQLASLAETQPPASPSAAEISDLQSLCSDLARTIFGTINYTTENVASSVSQPSEPVCYPEAEIISSVMQSPSGTISRDRISLEHQRESQRAIAVPFAAITTRHQPNQPSPPLAISATLSQRISPSRFAALEAELALLRSENQDITATQKEKEASVNISDEKATMKATAIAVYTATVHISPSPIRLAPPIALGPILSSDSPARYTKFDSESGSPPPSTTIHIVSSKPSPNLAIKNSPRHAISSKSLAFSPSKPLASACFSNLADSSFSSSSNSHIASPNKFLPLSSKNSTKRPIPVHFIADPSHDSLQPPPINSLVSSTTDFVVSMFGCFGNLISAVQLIATTFSALYTVLAHISALICFKKSAEIIISALSFGAIAFYCTIFLVFQSFFGIVATIHSSMRAPIHLFHNNISLASLFSCIFNFGHIFILKASPRPLKPDKPLASSQRLHSHIKRHVGSHSLPQYIPSALWHHDWGQSVLK